MKWLKLPGIVEWFDSGILAWVERKRRDSREVVRNRKLGTVELLWLMLAVSLNTGREGLHEILRLATADLGIGWNVSVAAFCKARKRFSPQLSTVSSRTAHSENLPKMRKQSGQMERAHAKSR